MAVTLATSSGICGLCEAACGILVEHDAGRVLSVRGDPDHPLSRGYVCPKAVSLRELHHDPDRVRHPLRRNGPGWSPLGWDEAIDEAGRRLAAVQQRYGRDAVAFYFGNPVAHSYSSILALLPFTRALGSRNVFSANSVDALPRLLVSYLLYGNQALLPVPDLDRTAFLLIIGANPAVSNGSVMCAPDVRRRIAAIRSRGGRVVVIDPRRTETAARADAHHFVRPGTDALLLLGMIHVLFEEHRVRTGALDGLMLGIAEVAEIASRFSPDRVAPIVGVSPETIVTLAREFSSATSAACYGRLGTCTQEFGTLTTWAIDLLNLLTGNVDRPGGMMFASPAVDLARLAGWTGQSGGFARWQSRATGLPEYNGELPAVALAPELETPGKGQVRALVCLAGNPALSLPNSRRLDKALSQLEFVVSIDLYVNETSRHAHIVLPGLDPLERDHFPLLEHSMSVRNFAQYAPAVIDPPESARADWRILIELASRLHHHRGGAGAWLSQAERTAGRLLKPKQLIDLALRAGPHRLSVKQLLAKPHGIDLGALEPVLASWLRRARRPIPLIPEQLRADIGRLQQRMVRQDSLLLIGRRDLRANNTWMHNLAGLSSAKRCTVQMNPQDAAARQLRDGELVRVASRVGEVTAPLELSAAVMPGVVCLPFGYGHGRPGVRLSAATRAPGVSFNDLTDDDAFDAVSAVAAVNGVPVTVCSVTEC